MADILKKLGGKNTRRKKRANLTQEKLAEKVDLSVDYIGYIERGKQAPYLKTLERIAKALGVEVYELFFFREDDKKKDASEAAIKELILTVHNKNPEDISFIASLLRQVFERRGRKKRRP